MSGADSCVAGFQRRIIIRCKFPVQIWMKHQPVTSGRYRLCTRVQFFIAGFSKYIPVPSVTGRTAGCSCSGIPQPGYYMTVIKNIGRIYRSVCHYAYSSCSCKFHCGMTLFYTSRRINFHHCIRCPGQNSCSFLQSEIRSCFCGHFSCSICRVLCFRQPLCVNSSNSAQFRRPELFLCIVKHGSHGINGICFHNSCHTEAQIILCKKYVSYPAPCFRFIFPQPDHLRKCPHICRFILYLLPYQLPIFFS